MSGYLVETVIITVDHLQSITDNSTKLTDGMFTDYRHKSNAKVSGNTLPRLIRMAIHESLFASLLIEP